MWHARYELRREPSNPVLDGYQRAAFADFLQTAQSEAWDPTYRRVEMGVETDDETPATPSP